MQTRNPGYKYVTDLTRHSHLPLRKSGGKTGIIKGASQKAATAKIIGYNTLTFCIERDNDNYYYFRSLYCMTLWMNTADGVAFSPATSNYHQPDAHRHPEG
ncbi:hypothetical protein [Serratia ureilytica]|uniref:hypothetical protein n=1 Tax=Serratia ureilytica TaxID=300181 RepID=UPI001F054D6C|nr:hypothetical protein [Serratia ureilytica]UMK52507.1 hypothetical protein L2D49_23105 [Serratia ureilytica]